MTYPGPITPGAGGGDPALASRVAVLEDGGLRTPVGTWRLPVGQVAASTSTATVGRRWWVPIDLGPEQTWDRIGCYIDTPAASSSLLVGLYTDAGGYPGDLLVEAPVIDASIGGARQAVIAATAAGPRIAWACAEALGGAATLRALGDSVDSVVDVGPALTWNGNVATASAARTGLSDTAGTGSLPATAPAGLAPIASAPALSIRAAT